MAGRTIEAKAPKPPPDITTDLVLSLCFSKWAPLAFWNEPFSLCGDHPVLQDFQCSPPGSLNVREEGAAIAKTKPIIPTFPNTRVEKY